MNRDRVIAASALLVVSTIMLIPVGITIFQNGMAYLISYLGFSDSFSVNPFAWIAAILVVLAYVSFTFWAIPVVRESQKELSWFKFIGVIAAVASGIMEEVIFRRWLMDTAAEFGISELSQIFLSGIAFGLAHSLWHIFSGDWEYSAWAVVATTFVGFALAGIYLMADRNLAPVVTAHFLINFFIEPWLVLSAITTRTKGIPLRN